MNDDAAQAIVAIIILIVCLLGIFVPLGAVCGYVFFQTSKRRRIRERVMAANGHLIGNHRWFPVRYASKPRFDSWFKIFPWEGAGIVVLAPGSVLFLGETNSGLPLNMQFAPSNSALSWLGKAPFPNGAVSWFVFDFGYKKEYFSSETGAFVFGSHRSTKEIFEEAWKSFSAGPQPS